MPLPLDPYDPTLYGDPAEGVISTGQAPSFPPAAAPRAKSSGFDARTMLGLGVGAIGDIFAEALSGGKTKGQGLSTALKALDIRRLEAIEERKAGTEEKKLQLDALRYQLSVGEFLQKGTNAQHENLGRFIGNLEKLSGTMATATPDERRIAGEGLKKFADDSNLGFAKIFVDKSMADPELGRHLGAAFQFVKDRPGAALFLSNGQAFQKDPKKFMDDFRDFASTEAIKEISARLPRVTGRLKQVYGDKPIPFDAVADLIAPDNEFVAQVFRGDVAVSDPIRKAMGSALARHGVELPDTAAKAAETKATTTAQKEVEEAFKVPGLAPAVLSELALKKLNPRTATPEQLQEAQTSASARETKMAGERTTAIERAKQSVEATAPEKPVTPQEVDRLRDDFHAATKSFVTVRDAYARVLASAKEPSAAGDLSLIFNYMKILDPGSVVREGEFAQAASTGSFGERIQGLVQKAMNGERLTETIRNDFTARARKLFAEQLGFHEQDEARFRGLAKKRNIDEGRVVTDLVGKLRPSSREVEPATGGDTPDARARAKFGVPKKK